MNGRPATPPRQPLRERSLTAQSIAGLRCLDVVVWPAGPGLAVRAFFASGTPVTIFDPTPLPETTTLTEIRDVSGGVQLAGVFKPANPALPATIPIATSTGTLHLTAAPAETTGFAGLNAAILIRMEEPAETVRDWLKYHAAAHSLQGAVIVNRAQTGGAAFANALRDLMAMADSDLELVVLHCPVPLGRADLGPEAHPFLAPDAPGKDRMAAPLPDPWRAPLGEPLIYEIVKWRFLARARAVLSLDVCDILAPRPQQPVVFDLALNAPKGVVALDGRRIYPWRVRAGQRARFGDHICRPFDAAPGMTRWCVAPELAGLEATWRTTRVSYSKTDPSQTTGFYRCMAIRNPGRATSELVPKTSLIEDPDLVALALDIFGHKPIRAPKSVPHAAPDAACSRTVIVTTMKNEGPFILEWLAYHRMIGVDDFLIYTNDCTDGTDTLLDLLQAKGYVQHRDNPFKAMDLKPQHAALQAAEAEPLIRNSGWAICMDVDEFISIKAGAGRLADLFAAIGDANMISLTWRLFGNSDVHAYADRFLLDQFSRCAPEQVRKPHQAWGFKTLFRNIGIFRKLGVHRPKGLKPDLWGQIRWLNGSGKPMPIAMLRNGWRSTTATYGYDLVSLNHYAVRSAESFLVKRDRGRVNHVDRDQGLNYWFRMNFNADQDRSIQRMIPALQIEYDRLLADPGIRAAHDHCVACHRARITELRATTEAAAFYAELTSDRMQKLCRLQAHFGTNVFSAGPQVIPPDLHDRDLPANFFFTVEPTGEAGV